MYGSVKAPFTHTSDRNHVQIRKFKGGVLYHRKTGEREVKKRIYSSGSDIRFLPVEPFNCPKLITSNLMIELTRTLVIPPKSSRTIYLRFPVEIGVIISKKGIDRVVDIFTENDPKYALYGDIKDGILCRYYGSDVHVNPPRTDPLHEGIVKVDVKNITPSWREVSMIVLQGNRMKVFYSDKKVIATAKAKLLDDENAETRFIDQPWKKGVEPSYKMLTNKTFSILSTKFKMEGGY